MVSTMHFSHEHCLSFGGFQISSSFFFVLVICLGFFFVLFCSVFCLFLFWFGVFLGGGEGVVLCLFLCCCFFQKVNLTRL